MQVGQTCCCCTWDTSLRTDQSSLYRVHLDGARLLVADWLADFVTVTPVLRPVAGGGHLLPHSMLHSMLLICHLHMEPAAPTPTYRPAGGLARSRTSSSALFWWFPSQHPEDMKYTSRDIRIWNLFGESHQFWGQKFNFHLLHISDDVDLSTVLSFVCMNQGGGGVFLGGYFGGWSFGSFWGSFLGVKCCVANVLSRNFILFPRNSGGFGCSNHLKPTIVDELRHILSNLY